MTNLPTLALTRRATLLAAAGAAPDAAALRDWLALRVPEYRPQPVRF